MTYIKWNTSYNPGSGVIRTTPNGAPVSFNVTIKEVLLEQELFSKEEIDNLLDPINITRPGVIKGGK